MYHSLMITQPYREMEDGQKLRAGRISGQKVDGGGYGMGGGRVNKLKSKADPAIVAGELLAPP